MIKKSSRSLLRKKRHYRMRKNLSGTAQKLRLTVFKSNKYIYAQLIDDVKGHTIVSASSIEPTFSKENQIESRSNMDAAVAVGKLLARRAIEKGVETIVFDRSGYIYHGKIKALADAAREAGLKF